MNKSATVLTASPEANAMRRPPLLWVFLGLGLVIYLFPWVVNAGSSLTLGGYDLAEWLSLSRDRDMMQTVLFLRLPLVCFALIAAVMFGAPRFRVQWWLAAGVILVMTVALLPPFEFIQDRANTNYQQQFMLALITLIGGGIGLSGLLPSVRPYIAAVIALIGAIVSGIGLASAYEFMQNLRLASTLGIGGIAVTLAFLAIAGLILWGHVKRGE